MARVNANVILHGVSGMLGDQVVVRQQQDGTYVLAARPARRKHRTFSPAQQAQQERFRRAALYARAAQGKPEYQALAKARRIAAFTVATTDYLTPPEILGIDLNGYHGAAGQEIVIAAIDDVKVTAVKVLLAQDDSTVIEGGAAVVDPEDPHRWVYTATTTAPSTSVAVFVDVFDLAGRGPTSATHT